MEGDGVGGRFGRSGSLVCRASHVITSLQVHDWPLCILVYQSGDPLNLFLCFYKWMLNFKNIYIITVVYLYKYYLFLSLCKHDMII